MYTLGTCKSKQNSCEIDLQQDLHYINTFNQNSERLIESWLATKYSRSKFVIVGKDFSPQQSKHTDTITNTSYTDKTHLKAPMKMLTFDNSSLNFGY